MGEMVTDLFHWLAHIPPFWAYTAILLIAYGENVIPPIPGDMVVVFGGYLAASGKLDLLPVIVVSTVGGALGFMTMYIIGHRVGDAVMETHRLRWLPKERIRRAHDWLEHWGLWVVGANRFLSGARSIISLSVGMARLDPTRTAICATVSALVWTALIAYGGYELGDNWTIIGSYLRAYGTAITVVGVAIAAGIALRYYLKWRKSSQDRSRPPDDVMPHR